MAEFSSLVAIYFDPDSGAPSGLQALVDGDTISSSVLDSGSRETLTRVVDSSAAWEAGLDAETYDNLVITSARALDMVTFSASVQTSTANIDTSTRDLITSSTDISSYINTNEAGWNAGLDADTLADIVDVSTNFSTFSGDVETSTYNIAGSATDISAYIADNEATWEAGGGEVSADGFENWDNTYDNVSNASGDRDRVVAYVTGASADIYDASTNFGTFSGDVEASFVSVAGSAIDISGYISDNESGWAAGVDPGLLADIESVSGTVLDGSGNWDNVYTNVRDTSGDRDRVITYVTQGSGNIGNVSAYIGISSGALNNVKAYVVDTSARDDQMYDDVSNASGNWNTIYGDRDNIVDASTNFATFSGDVEASFVSVAGSAIDISAYIDANESGWAAGIDPGFYNDVESVSGTVLDGSGNWDNVYTNVRDTSGDRDRVITYVTQGSGNIGNVSAYVGTSSGALNNVKAYVVNASANIESVSGSVLIGSGDWDNVYVNVNDTSGDRDRVIAYVTGASADIYDASTNFGTFSGDVEASFVSVAGSAVDISAYIDANESTWAAAGEVSADGFENWNNTYDNVSNASGDRDRVVNYVIGASGNIGNVSSYVDGSANITQVSAYVTGGSATLTEASTLLNTSDTALLTGATPTLSNSLDAGENSLSGVASVHWFHANDPSGSFYIRRVNDNTTTVSGNGIFNLRNRLNRNDYVGDGTIGDFTMSASRKVALVHDPDSTEGITIGRAGIGTAFETNDFKASADNWSDVYDNVLIASAGWNAGGGGTQIQAPRNIGGVVYYSGTGDNDYGDSEGGTAGTYLTTNGTRPYWTAIRSNDIKTEVGGNPTTGQIMVGNGGGSFVAGDHGNLAGLDDDDHPQYTLSATNLALSDSHYSVSGSVYDNSAQWSLNDLSTLDDTSITSPVDGQIIVWDEGTGSWANDYNNKQVMAVRNATASTIFKGQAIYVSGFHNANVTNVGLARADSQATMPAIGILNQDLTAGSEGLAITFGKANGLDTSLLSEGGKAYVSPTVAGALTATRPTNTYLVQNVGVVVRVDGSNGIIRVTGIGRSNDIPNAAEATSPTAVDYVYVDDGYVFKKITLDNIAPGINHVNLSGVGTNTHAQIDTHIADGTVHFTEGSIDHTNITNIGTNTHAQIDTHIADSTIHFTEGSIDHTNITNIGTNTHPQIDEHIAGVVAASGNWQTAYTTDLFPSATGFANWNTIYGDRDNIISVSSTVLNNSGTWGGGASAEGFENWNNTYAWTAGASADVVSVSSTVLNNSATWGVDTDTTDHTLLSNIGTNTHAQIDEHITGVTTASGNWQTAYTTDLFPSAAGYANWNTAYGDRDNNISVSTTVLNNSATWATDTDTTDHTLLSNIGTNTHAQIDTHIADSTIHFTEGSIDHTNITNIGTNTHAQIDAHIGGVVAASGNWESAYTIDLFPSAAGFANWNAAYGDRTNNISVSTTVLNNSATWAIDTDTTDHTALTNIGTNTHAQIDTHIADSTIHFTEGSIDHTNITNVGTNTHAQIDAHITGVTAASGNWEGTYDTVLNNSATWGGGGSPSAEGYENWNNTYEWASAASADIADVSGSVFNTSANWDEAYLSATNTTDVSSIFADNINVVGYNAAHSGTIGTTDAATFGIQSNGNTSIIAPSIILSATTAYQFRKNGSTTYTDTDFPQSCRDWDSTYGTVLNNSGTWGGGGGGGGVAAGVTIVNTGTDNIDSAGALVPLDTSTSYPAYGTYGTDYSYTAGNSYVTINTAGTYEVTFNVAYTSTVVRWNGILKIYKGTGGAAPSSWIGYGASKMGYVRSSSGHNEASLILTCLVTCSANDTIGGWVEREAATGTCSVVANESFMTIKRMA